MEYRTMNDYLSGVFPGRVIKKTLKLHQLQVVKGTAPARMYEQNPASIPLFNTPQEYAAVVSAFIEKARPDLCYDRFVSETPKNMLIAPI